MRFGTYFRPGFLIQKKEAPTGTGLLVPLGELRLGGKPIGQLYMLRRTNHQAFFSTS
jgi:hypothetical protein